jgi:hypothetical protein
VRRISLLKHGNGGIVVRLQNVDGIRAEYALGIRKTPVQTADDLAWTEPRISLVRVRSFGVDVPDSLGPENVPPEMVRRSRLPYGTEPMRMGSPKVRFTLYR